MASSMDPEKATASEIPVSDAPTPVVTEKSTLATERSRAPPTSRSKFSMGDVILRSMLFCTCLTSVVVMVTSKTTKFLQMPIPPFFPVVPRSAKFGHSSAFIYFVVALSLAGLYSIISGALSFLASLKADRCSSKLAAHFLILDVLMLGIVASAVGAAGAVGYIGLNGNSHVNWGKICNIYGKFCNHIAASILIALVGAIILVLLVINSAWSLSKRIPK